MLININMSFQIYNCRVLYDASFFVQSDMIYGFIPFRPTSGGITPAPAATDLAIA